MANREFSEVIVSGEHDPVFLDRQSGYHFIGGALIGLGDVTDIVAGFTQARGDQAVTTLVDDKSQRRQAETRPSCAT